MPCIGVVGKRRSPSSTLSTADEPGRQLAPSGESKPHVSARSQSGAEDEFRCTAIVELHRQDASDLGLVITGGIDKEVVPRVAYLKPGSVAQRCDALEVGDVVIAINGNKTTCMKHADIVSLLRSPTVSPTTIEVEYSLPDPQQMSFSVLCKRLEVTLVRDAGGTFGMTLRGGASVDPGKCRPLTVTQMRPGGPADREGTLKVGDRVLAANGISLMQRTLGQALNFLRDVPDDEVAFLVEYDVSVLEVVQNATGPLLVEIDKLPGNPLGVTLAQGCYRGRRVIYIDCVAAASIADRCGALHVGDHVLSADGVSFTDGLPVTEATKLVTANAGSQIQLEVVPAALVRSETEPVPASSAPSVAEEKSPDVPAPGLLENSALWNGVAGARLSSLSLNSACSSILSHGTCASMTTHVGSAVAQYGTFRRLGLADHGSLDRSTAWDSLGRHSTVSGTSTVVAYSPAAQVCHLDTTEVMLFADQHRRSLGGAAPYGMAIDPGGVTALQNGVLAQPPVVSCIEPKGPAERCGVIQEGDRIIAVNGQYLEGRTMEEIYAFIAESSVKMILTVGFRVAESIIPSSGVFVVKLAKRGAGLGITISCPRNRRHGQHLIISDVKKGSVAHRTGSIQPGDQLLAIDNVRLDNCTLEDSARVLQDTHDIVKLTIKKDENFADEPDPTHLITYTVELPKFAGPLGITISGSEEPFDPVFISSLTEDGLAQKTGALHVGDRLLAINGVSLRGKTLTDAVHLLQNAGDTVTVKITRPANVRPHNGVGHTCVNGAKYYDSMDSALESWDSNGLDGVTGKDKSISQEPQPFDGSSNGSNNTNKETRSSSGSADRSASGRFTTGDTDDTVTVRPGRRSTTSTDDPAVTPAVVDAASAGGSGSVDDEWSRQMDELDRLRPVVTFHDADDRLVVDSFTDLPDVIIDDEDEDDDVDDHAVSVKQTTVQQRAGALTSSVHDVTCRAESGILDCDQMSTVSDVTTADFHLREVEEQLENIFTPTPIELLKVTLRRPRETDDFGFSLSDGVFEKGVYVGAVRPGGPAAGALKPYDRVLQVNGVRTKDLDCCQVVPLIVQVTGREAHLVISRNPLVWNSEVTPDVQRCRAAAAGPPPPPRHDQTPVDVHACPAVHDGDRGIAR